MAECCIDAYVGPCARKAASTLGLPAQASPLPRPYTIPRCRVQNPNFVENFFISFSIAEEVRCKLGSWEGSLSDPVSHCKRFFIQFARRRARDAHGWGAESTATPGQLKVST